MLLVALCLLLVGCRFGGRPTPTPIALPANLQTPSATTTVDAFPVIRGEVVQLETFSGRVTPAREEDLFFRRGGQIADVFVRDGDRVEAGDLIATLDNSLIEIDLESALLGLAIAKENLQQAEANLRVQRQQAETSLEIAQLRLQGAADQLGNSDSSVANVLEEIRKLEVQQAELALTRIDEAVDPVLALNVQRAELSVERIKQTILEGQINAPFAGEVRFINLPEEDELLAVSSYSAVARLVDATEMKIELNLTRTQLQPLVEGMPVQITSAALANQVLAGEIAALPRPFGTSQGSLTEVALHAAALESAEELALREGVTVAVEVRLQSKPNALIIPRAALQEENQLYYVGKYEENEIRRANVAVGVISSDYVEILAGLEENDQVVVP